LVEVQVLDKKKYTVGLKIKLGKVIILSGEDLTARGVAQQVTDGKKNTKNKGIIIIIKKNLQYTHTNCSNTRTLYI